MENLANRSPELSREYLLLWMERNFDIIRDLVTDKAQTHIFEIARLESDNYRAPHFIGAPVYIKQLEAVISFRARIVDGVASLDECQVIMEDYGDAVILNDVAGLKLNINESSRRITGEDALQMIAGFLSHDEEINLSRLEMFDTLAHNAMSSRIDEIYEYDGDNQSFLVQSTTEEDGDDVAERLDVVHTRKNPNGTTNGVRLQYAPESDIGNGHLFIHSINEGQIDQSIDNLSVEQFRDFESIIQVLRKG